MDIELHAPSDNGRSPGGYALHHPTDLSRFRSIQCRDETERPSTEALLIGELLRHIHDLRARVERLEGRVPSVHRTDPATGIDPEPEPEQHELDDLDDVADAATPAMAEGTGGLRLADLPRGPLSIDVVAKALNKTMRTIRGWCQAEKYDVPCHKEGGRWHFYKDELVAWYPEYERVSRRDAKRAQAKRRRAKNGSGQAQR